MTEKSADVTLDAEHVGRVVSSQFADFHGRSVRRLGSGWDHDVYILGDTEWVFRFPKRSERVPWLLRELQILDRVAPVLGDVVPRFDYVGEPSELFPYPFVGYRFFRGGEADHVLGSPGVLANEIGLLLARLHAIDPAGVPPPPDGHPGRGVDGSTATSVREDEDPGSYWTRQLLSVSALVGERLGEPVRNSAEPYLEGEVRVPALANTAPRRLCHNDICAEHLIIDPQLGRITGLLDWTDAMVTDPVVDFTGLLTVGGYEFIVQVVKAYVLGGGAGIDEKFWERLVWWCRTMALFWLGEALQGGAPNVSRHLSWVERAFAEPDP